MEGQVSVPRRRRRTAIASVAALAVLTGATACGSSSSGSPTSNNQAAATTTAGTTAGNTTAGSGVTDYLKYTGGTKGPADSSKSKVYIGWVNLQGGPADISPFATNAAQTAVKYINTELGGVDGHPVQLVTCYVSTSEAQGQACGQQLLNNKNVDVIANGAVSLGAQSLLSTIHGAKPMVYSVAAGPTDASNQNGYILFGDLVRILPPFATFVSQVLHKKTAATIYPNAAGVPFAAQALAAGYKAAGVTFKQVSFPPDATDLLGPLTAAGAQSADVVTPVLLAPQCANTAKAIQQASITAAVVSTPLCLNTSVAKALGGDFPKWYYSIASSLAADTTDPASRAMVAVVAKYGNVKELGDPFYGISVSEILTIDKWMNAIGANKLTPASIAAEAKAFKGPLAFGPPKLDCGKYPHAPGICSDEQKFYKYEGKGVFKPVSGWLGPPPGFQG